MRWLVAAAACMLFLSSAAPSTARATRSEGEGLSSFERSARRALEHKPRDTPSAEGRDSGPQEPAAWQKPEVVFPLIGVGLLISLLAPRLLSIFRPKRRAPGKRKKRGA